MALPSDGASNACIQKPDHYRKRGLIVIENFYEDSTLHLVQ